MKKGLTAAVAVLLAASPALALEVTESARLNAPVDKVWKQIGPFCQVSDWHPAIEKCELRRQDGALNRVMAVKGGGAIEERLLASSETKHSVRYAIVASPLPVKDYTATITLIPAGNMTKIVWSAKFTANGTTETEARKTISGIFTSGFDGLKRKLGAG